MMTLTVFQFGLDLDVFDGVSRHLQGEHLERPLLGVDALPHAQDDHVDDHEAPNHHVELPGLHPLAIREGREGL